MTFFYSEERPTTDLQLAPLTARAVAPVKKIVFTPGWTTPVRAFSWANATLSKADDQVNGENLRHLQFRATGREVFGPHYVFCNCEASEAGRYDVLVQAIAGPAQGQVGLFENDIPIGRIADLFSSRREKTAEIPMGQLDLAAGANPVMFKIVGKNARSSGLGFDVYRIVLRKAEQGARPR